MKNNSTIYILMSLSMILWAVAWTSAKIVNEYFTFYNLVFLRFSLGFIFLIPLISIKKFSKLNIANSFNIFITSILFFIYNICFFKGTYYGLAGKGAILVTTINPIVTLIIISLINKKINKNEFIGMLFGFIGGIFILGIFNNGINVILYKENYYFLTCAIIWGIITVLTKYGQKNLNSYLYIFLCYFITTLISLAYVDFSNIKFSHLDNKFYIHFMIVSIGAMSFGTSIYMYSTKILGAVKSSAFIFSVPFIAIVTSNLILNEPITLNIIIGGFLSLFGVYLSNK